MDKKIVDKKGMEEKTGVMYGDFEVFNRSQTEIDRQCSSEPGPSTSTGQGKITSFLQESPLSKRKCETATCETPEKKQKMSELKETIQVTLSDIDLYNTSAAYYFTQKNIKEGTAKIDKGKRIANSHLQKALYLVDEFHKEMVAKNQIIQTEVVAKNQMIFSLEKNNNQLKQQLNNAISERDLLKKQIVHLKQELDEIKEDNELLNCDMSITELDRSTLGDGSQDSNKQA